MRIAIHGAKGRMGKAIVSALAEHGSCIYAGAVTRDGFIPDCDVVIDVTSPEGTQNLLTFLGHVPLLIGTTGDLPEKEIACYAEYAPVAVTSNFSNGIQMLCKMISLLSAEDIVMYRPLIEGRHHQNKKIIPSGTSVILAGIIEGITGHSVRIESVCEGETAGEHAVILETDDERIEIRHFAKNQKIMADGAIRLAEWLVQQPCGWHKV